MKARQSQNSCLSKDSKQPTERSFKIYLANVRQLLTKIRRLKLAEPLDESEFSQIALDWAEILITEVPLDRMTEVYIYTVKNHNKPYFIDAFDILASMRTILKLEAEAEANRIKESQSKIDAVELCLYKSEHINSEGESYYLNPATNQFDLILPCVHCRKKAYHLQRERWFTTRRLRNAKLLLLFSIIKGDVVTALVMKECFLNE